MTVAESAPLPYLNLAAPDFSIISEEVAGARADSWVARTNYGLAVLRYDEVARLLKHPKLRQGSFAWPSLNGVDEGLFASWWANWILHKEGADHKRLRRLLNPAFSPRLLEGLKPRFEALADELIDTFIDRGECEFVREFADPYAARVLAIMLGLEESEWAHVAEHSSVVGLALGVTIRADLETIEASLAALYDYAGDLIADRRSHPRDDFVTTLVRASDGGDSLDDQELRDTLVVLIFAGYDTTKNQLGLAMTTFASHLDQWDLLGKNQELRAAAVEEVMRVNPTTRWVTRQATETFTFQDFEIDSGTTVHLFTESAGTDSNVFTPPAFDITVERKPHFGFGGGAHHCLGHFVARSDMSIALGHLSRRIGPFRIGDAQMMPDSGNTGPVKLPLTFGD